MFLFPIRPYLCSHLAVYCRTCTLANNAAAAAAALDDLVSSRPSALHYDPESLSPESLQCQCQWPVLLASQPWLSCTRCPMVAYCCLTLIHPGQPTRQAGRQGSKRAALAHLRAVRLSVTAPSSSSAKYGYLVQGHADLKGNFPPYVLFYGGSNKCVHLRVGGW